jgi:WD40 repeat protein
MAGSGELAIRLRTSSRQPTHFAIWSFEYKGWWNDHTKAWVRGIEDGTIYTQNYEANEECIRILQETGHTHQLRSIPIDPTNYKPLAFGAFA